MHFVRSSRKRWFATHFRNSRGTYKASGRCLKTWRQLLVKVIEIDKQGRVNLSRKVVIQEEKERAEQEK